MNQEYLSLREAQDKIIGSLDQVLPMIARGVQENAMAIQENRKMLLAIIEHLQVPYKPKRPIGFNTEPDADA